MPICPFCRKPVGAGSIWCSCGANLNRYPDLPVNPEEIKEWLAEHKPELLSSSWTGGLILEAARKRLIGEQEEEIKRITKIKAEVDEAKSLIESFLLDCRREGMAPTIDIGQLRRERWRQWKRLPTEYRQHPPLKDFRFTPGFFFETPIGQFNDEYCLALDGSIYKHQLNAPDPYPLRELVGNIPVDKLADALTMALVRLLKLKQQPHMDQAEPAEGPIVAEPADVGPAGAGRGAKTHRFKLPFGKNAAKPAAGETAEAPADENPEAPAASEAAEPEAVEPSEPKKTPVGS